VLIQNDHRLNSAATSHLMTKRMKTTILP